MPNKRPTMSKAKGFKASSSNRSSVPEVAKVNDDHKEKPFRLQDLPPEIRYKVYHQALTNNTPIELTNERLDFRSGISQERKARMGKLRLDDGLYILLLTACDWIRKEAVGVLYGRNRFLFADFKVLEQFLQLIGCDNRKHLKYITINGDFQKLEARSAGSMLTDARYLKDIHFGPWNCKLETFANNIWDWLRPVLVAIYRANKKFDGGIDNASIQKAINVISFEYGTCSVERTSNLAVARRSRSTAKTHKESQKNKEATRDMWLKSDRDEVRDIWTKRFESYLKAPNYTKRQTGNMPGY